MRGCVSHRGEEGSVGVLDVSDTSVRSEAKYARIARSFHHTFILEIVVESRVRWRRVAGFGDDLEKGRRK